MNIIWPYGLSSIYLLTYLPLIVFIGSLSVVLYRLTFHPLARFPGPILAASTGLYEAYYQCIKDGGGRYWVEIQKMHQRYGPIVRINPWEVHIADPDWNAVYKYSAKASKPRWFYFRFFGKFPSTNVAESHALHQLRRGPLQTYFASSNIQRYMPTIVAQVDKLCARLRAVAANNDKDNKNSNSNSHSHNSKEDGNVVSLSDAFRCLATDVATGFAFGAPFGHLDEPSFDREFNLSVKMVVKASMWSRHTFGLFLPVLHSLPESIARRMNPAFGRVMWMKDTMISCVRRSMNKPEPAPGSPQDMIQTLLASNLPAEEKTFPRLFSESRSVIMAGTETTATTLVCITSNLLSDPAKAQKLRHELSVAEMAKGGALEYADLRELPYITGVINEGLRLANPTPSRLPRVCEDQDLTYKQWVIPRGTTISTTTQDIHDSPSIFANPTKFLPERWADPAERRRLNKYLQPWGRGTRLCLGTELATIDAYLAVSRLFGPSAGFDMRIHDTKDEDWVAYHEWFAGFPKGKGLRVRVFKSKGNEKGNI
ncbi:putative cytochrome P450 [Annulohypoxylon truncatum]|uniref:putative cytochrome P450 n=1 Tax=Annulohypoxylon truncatum TaxID=327061 RepID=UPI00200739E5|nr:putative cytochrome P450 [Annulohypoxylon truncatum]KAI1211984.1 putative cytochrome P450 [Annulohypoxylon truncatum]